MSEEKVLKTKQEEEKSVPESDSEKTSEQKTQEVSQEDTPEDTPEDVSDEDFEKDEKEHVIAPVDEESPDFKGLPADLEGWKPRTALGRGVKKGEFPDIDKVIDSGSIILEPEIVDALVPDSESELLLIGQSKGKFGGGQRRVFRQTQKKTKEGNKPSFATYAVVGDRRGHVGVGYGKAKETVPAREKAIRRAKLSFMKIRRGCGSWQCNCKEPHSIPFRVSGKCGSVVVDIIPAPKGTGLVTETEIQKILSLAGVEDAWSKTRGKTSSRLNLIKATVVALKKLTSTKIQSRHTQDLNISE